MLFHARLILILGNFNRAAFSPTFDKVLIFYVIRRSLRIFGGRFSPYLRQKRRKENLDSLSPQ